MSVGNKFKSTSRKIDHVPIYDFSIENLLDQTKPIFAYDLFRLILSWWLSKAFAKKKGTNLDVTPTKTDTTMENTHLKMDVSPAPIWKWWFSIAMLVYWGGNSFSDTFW